MERIVEFTCQVSPKGTFCRRMKSVLVTGATGHVGYNLCSVLSREGYRVKAGVRSPSDTAKNRHVKDLGVDLVAADIMRPAEMESAMRGVDGVFHVAAVYQNIARNPQTEIIEPTINGCMNTLRAAKEAGVKKFILTSSTAAIGMKSPADRPLDERDWNHGATDPYVFAKTRAEELAWDFAEEHKMNLVAVNPAGIIGPGFFRHTPTTQFFEMALRGKMPVAPPFGFCYVDVRDVARLHLMAYENDKARGRYIAADGYYTIKQLTDMIGEMFPGTSVPKFVLPEFMTPAALAFDWMSNAVTGAPRQLSWSMIKEYTGNRQLVSSQKARIELGWEPMDFKKSVKDTLDWITATFIRGKK